MRNNSYRPIVKTSFETEYFLFWILARTCAFPNIKVNWKLSTFSIYNLSQWFLHIFCKSKVLWIILDIDGVKLHFYFNTSSFLCMSSSNTLVIASENVKRHAHIHISQSFGKGTIKYKMERKFSLLKNKNFPWYIPLYTAAVISTMGL